MNTIIIYYQLCTTSCLVGCAPSLSLWKTRKLEHLLRVENIFEITWLLCLFWQRKFKVHLPHLSLRVHPASDFFCVFEPLFCPNQLGQELPEGLQKFLERVMLAIGNAVKWFCGRSRRSFSTILSSISDDLWLCAEEGFVYPPDGPDGQRLIWTEAPRGSTRPINCLVCLARTHCFNGLFMSLLRFSCNKSI